MVIFLRGLFMGIAIAAPVGPIGVLCIRRTLSNGRVSGFISGLGAATADAFYGSIAALGLTFISTFLIEKETWLHLVGGIFLCYLGIKTFLEKPTSPNSILPPPYGHHGQSDQGDSSLDQPKSPSDARAPHNRSLIADYASTFFLTLTNPLTIISFAAIFAGLNVDTAGGSPPAALSLVLGVFFGSTLWWLLLSTTVAALRTRFLSHRGLHWVNWISGLIITGFGLAALLSIILPLTRSNEEMKQLQARLVAQAAPTDIDGYTRAVDPRVFTFPADSGPHPDYQTEWWYYTGNLESPDGYHFGYQLTFFRRAILPPDQIQGRSSNWVSNQVYMAHFALTDVTGERHQAFERLARGAAGLSGAQAAPFQIWLEDWRVEQIGASLNSSTPAHYRLHVSQEEIVLDLTLTDIKGPILQGDLGYSRKGPEPGQASYYYSLTRLSTSGSVQISDKSYSVRGDSWMDHEFSTSALSLDQVGWDWFSLQFDDGSELMVFQIRKADGTIDPFSSGTLIAPDGTTTNLSNDDFEIQVEDTWISPISGATYPARWRMKIPRADLSLQIEPRIANQELNVSYTYWEGAVHTLGTRGGRAIHGNGYVELTGYSGSMGGEF